MISNEELGMRNIVAEQEELGVHLAVVRATGQFPIGLTTSDEGTKSLEQSVAAAELRNAQLEGIVNRLHMENTELSRENDALRAQLEPTDFTRLIQESVRQAVDMEVEKYMEADVFSQQITRRLEKYLENTDIECECEDAVERAIEEALGNVRISFRS